MDNSITVPITFLISMVGLASVFGMWAFFLFYKWNKTIKSCDEWEERYYKEYARRMERSR
mgnify:FL=1